ncbi:MAG: hypothetical protein A3D44_00385 [Candidatus Staskawiczbacteria bacterium RIFCSPHIGHO2_02_FULL_42_22]|uniref:Uncharacterized protein n=1 Tax=Candidatus Staskawiczbacteria bacterium RIFCSPHIGHO2_02_FULL_42_22 TaxID=1802207 RepID=A0A1G2I4T9_9BACT|nr:MAG: hypothetical protein A3D44_00385 [Candidatus Staskawiczbacteria bacterium RIFCSPHIGHO2_02_FULL_42_22]
MKYVNDGVVKVVRGQPVYSQPLTLPHTHSPSLRGAPIAIVGDAAISSFCMEIASGIAMPSQ